MKFHELWQMILGGSRANLTLPIREGLPTNRPDWVRILCNGSGL